MVPSPESDPEVAGGDGDADDVDPGALVDRLGTDGWLAARDRLDEALETASPDRRTMVLTAILEGTDHDDPDVRKWCVALLDHHGTERCVPALRRALSDPIAAVRRHAVHSVGCQSCKDDPLDIDVVGLLVERVETESSIRVRRAATHMLGEQPPDSRARACLDRLIEREAATDETLLRNARWARERHGDRDGAAPAPD